MFYDNNHNHNDNDNNLWDLLDKQWLAVLQSPTHKDPSATTVIHLSNFIACPEVITLTCAHCISNRKECFLIFVFL
jgi:hypothetical protein